MGRVLVLIQVRRRVAPPQDKHTPIQPTHQLNYPKARKFAANPLGKSSALPFCILITFRHLFYSFFIYLSDDTALVYAVKVIV